MAGKHFKNFINGINFGSLPSAPITGVTNGDVYYDSTLGSHRFRQGGSWVVPLNIDTLPHSPGWGNLATAPVVGVADGDVYYDTVIDKHFFRQDGAWVSIGVDTEFNNGNVGSSFTINLDNGNIQKVSITNNSTFLSMTGGAVGPLYRVRCVFGDLVPFNGSITFSGAINFTNTDNPSFNVTPNDQIFLYVYSTGPGTYIATAATYSGFAPAVPDVMPNGFASFGGGYISGNQIYTFGLNTTGQLGDGTINPQATARIPVSTTATRKWSQLSMGQAHTAAIESTTGNVYAWGQNTNGKLGDNSIIDRSSPVSVFGGKSYSAIFVGSTASVAIEASTGLAYTWGASSNGQLGNNQVANNHSSPVSVFGDKSFSVVSNGGSTMYAIDGLGFAWFWGTNSFNEGGDTTTQNRSSPTSVVGGRSFSKIVYRAAIEGSTGNIYCWGDGLNGVNGDGTTSSRNSPVSAVGGRSFKALVSGGSVHMAALEGSTGNAYAWGVGASGQLGNGDISNRSSPTSVLGGRSYTQIFSGQNHICAVEGSTGAIWAWGTQVTGIGRIRASSHTRPSPIEPPLYGNRSFSAISSGPFTTLQIVALEIGTGNAYAWGTNGSGSVGDNTIIGRSSPVSVVGGKSFTAVASAGSVVIALEGSTGTAWCWGAGSGGALGDNTTNNRSSPTSVLGGRSYRQIVSNGAMYALESSTGLAWAWGGSALGDNTSVAKSSPVSVVGDRSFSFISAGSGFAHAIEASTGNAYGWGTNLSGQVGDNLTISAQISPVSVAGGRSFSSVSGGGSHAAAIEASTGNAYCWGSGASGQVGNNTNNRSSPISVVGGKSFRRIITGDSHTVAIEASTGLAWAWGLNSSGQLGDGTLVSKSSPTSVFGGKSWSTISTVRDTLFGISSNIVYVWGDTSASGSGAALFGDGYTTAFVSPISIGRILPG